MAVRSLSILVVLLVGLSRLASSRALFVKDFTEDIEAKIAVEFQWTRHFKSVSPVVKTIFQSIDNDLRKSVMIGDPKVNLDRAIKFLEITQGLKVLSNAYIESRKILMNVKSYMNLCDLRGFGAMRMADLAVNSGAHKRLEMISSTGYLDRTFHLIFKSRAQNCGSEYMELYERLRKSTNKFTSIPKLNGVEMFSNVIIKSKKITALDGKSYVRWKSALHGNPDVVISLMDSTKRLLPFIDDKLVFETFEYIVKGDTRKLYEVDTETGKEKKLKGKKILDVDMYKELFEDYIIEPCKKYVRLVAPIFIPASFDLMTLRKSFPVAGSHINDFNESLILYRVCANVMVTKRDILDRMIGFGLKSAVRKGKPFLSYIKYQQ